LGYSVREAGARAIVGEETNPLIDYENRLGAEAMLAVPTPDHYLPLLYVIDVAQSSQRTLDCQH